MKLFIASSVVLAKSILMRVKAQVKASNVIKSIKLVYYIERDIKYLNLTENS